MKLPRGVIYALLKLSRASSIIESRIVNSPQGTSFEKPEDWDLLKFDKLPSKDMWEKMCHRMGHDPEAKLIRLGKGDYGVAYALTNGRAAKITTSDREASTALYVMERQSQSKEMLFLFYNIYDVFPIRIGKEMRYVIVTEILEKFEGEHKGTWLELADKWYYFVQDRKKFAGKMPPLLPQYIPEFITWMRDFNMKITPPEKKWLEDVAKVLAGGNKKEQIRFSDLHSGNIMWRPSTKSPVLIDLGGSQSPPASQKMPPAVARLSKKLP